MQQDNHGTIGGPGLGITDIEDAGLDLFQYGKRVWAPGPVPDLPSPDCASRVPPMTNGAAASVAARVQRTRRRSGLAGCDINLTPITSDTIRSYTI